MSAQKHSLPVDKQMQEHKQLNALATKHGKRVPTKTLKSWEKKADDIPAAQHPRQSVAVLAYPASGARNAARVSDV